LRMDNTRLGSFSISRVQVRVVAAREGMSSIIVRGVNLARASFVRCGGGCERKEGEIMLVCIYL
jgi:hypothetical protein